MTTPNSPSSGTTASSGNVDATLKDSAQQLGQQAKDKGREQVEAAREGTASHLDTLADSARAAADEMRDNDVANLSQYLTRMADGMSDFASRVRNKSGEEVFSEVRRLAQENPGLFVMGGLAVGFGLARFAKASASDAQDNSGSDRSQWRTGSYGGASTGSTGYATGSDLSGSGATGRADRPGADVVASAGSLHSSGTGSTGALGSSGSLGGSGLSGGSNSGLGGVGSGTSGGGASTAGTGSPSGGTLGGSTASGTPGERRDGLNAGTSDVGTGNNGLNHPASQSGAQSLGGYSATGPGSGTGPSNPNRGGQTR